MRGSRTVTERHEFLLFPFALNAPFSSDFANLTRCGVGCLFPVLAEAELRAVPTIQTLLQVVINSHLNYALSLHGKEPPQEQPSNREESQDEYGQFDLNWDDPMVLDALNNAAESAPVPLLVAAATTMQYTYQSLIKVRRSHVTHIAPF